MSLGPIRHEQNDGYKKKRGWFPIPSADWQALEYERLMGRPPPENKASWQWDYNPRRKASQKAFEDFIK